MQVFHRLAPVLLSLPCGLSCESFFQINLYCKCEMNGAPPHVLRQVVRAIARPGKILTQVFILKGKNLNSGTPSCCQHATLRIATERTLYKSVNFCP
jgi:hypothetical protein